MLSLVVYESLTPAALTRLVGAAPATLARRLNVLLERGWIAHRPNPAQAGSWVLEITDAGREQIGRGVPIADQFLDTLDDALRRARASTRTCSAPRCRPPRQVVHSMLP